MKKIYLAIIAILISVSIFAQIPQKMTYQAVIRSINEELVTNQSVGVKMSILQGETAETATVVYAETHQKTTNKNGLLTLEIGSGIVETGDFTAINWGEGNFFVRTETDPNGGTNYSINGTSALLATPYAFYAKEVENKDDADADPANEIQNLSLNGNQLSISNGNTITLPASSGGTGGDNWGSQTVATDATIDGNGLVSTPLTIAQQGATTGQALKWNGSTWTPEDDFNDDADADPENEIQSLSINGDQLSISDGNTITLPASSGGTGGDNWGSQTVASDATLVGDGTAANPLAIDNSQIEPEWGNVQNIPAGFADNTDDVDDADADPENEIQSLSINGDQLSISGGNTVTLSASGGGAGDNWGTQTAVTGNSISGNGLATSPLDLAQQDASIGQVLKWGGKSWVPEDDEVGDDDSENEIQSLAISGNELSISGGNAVTLPTSEGGTPGGDQGSIQIRDGNSFAGSSDLKYDATNKQLQLGAACQPTGDYSVAMGVSTIASGDYSIAMGRGTIASGFISTAFGYQTKASNEYSTAMGFDTKASGIYSFAMGYQTDASGSYSTAMGYKTTASGPYSTAIGSDGATASGFGSVALGHNTVAPGSAECAVGMFNTNYTPSSSYSRIFSIGIGAVYMRKNALTVLTNGNIGIGTDTPSALLHLADDEGEAVFNDGKLGIGTTAPADALHLKNSRGGAKLRLEGNGTGTSTLGFYSGSTYQGSMGYRAEDDYMFIYHNGNIVVKNGRIGIQSVSDPSYAIELPNSSKNGTGKARAYSWDTYSDGRLKTNRKTLAYGLADVMQMNPVSYFQHHSTVENNILEILESGQENIGFIAQDMYKIIPEVVTKPEDENTQLWAMDYEKLTPVLVKAIQEQQAQIEQLISEKAALTQANEDVISRLEKLEALIEMNLADK